jgi:hypothetical protein
VNDRDWLGEALDYLRKKFALFCEKSGQSALTNQLRVNPPFALGEAKHFLIGLENDLFDIDPNGRAQSALLQHSREESSLSHFFPIFVAAPSPPHLIRENLSRLAVASMIVFGRGWLPSQVRIQTDDAVSSGVDAIIESFGGGIVAAIEIKRSAFELQKFAGDFRQCCRRGAHPRGDCAFQQNHGVFEFCARSRPRYLWIVAPTADVCFKLSYTNTTVEVEELLSLPPRSHIEFGLKPSGT